MTRNECECEYEYVCEYIHTLLKNAHNHKRKIDLTNQSDVNMRRD